MRITPLDILQKKFSKKFKGFETEDVKAFLKLAGEEMTVLLRENAAIKEEVRRVENQVQEFQVLESSLRDTLIGSQEFVHKSRENAVKNSKLLQEQSEREAQELLSRQHNTITRIHEDISRLKSIRVNFKEEMKGLIESSLMKIDTMDR